MREFSDDGLTLTGAYGPKIVAQLGYVVDTIYADADTRQATLTLWTPSPVSSKDIPCTVAMDFKLRGGKLNMCVFMRSSDIWLGMPYDMFSFACVAYTVIARLRKHTDFNDIEPGFLWITAASSHLYEDRLGDIIEMGDVDPLPIPDDFWMSEELLHERLTAMRASHKGDPCRWWE
jgi:thymidylate synthase